MLAEQIQKYPKDFQLIIKDPQYTLWIEVHKLVLKAQSPFFERTLCGGNSFTYLWKVDNIRDAQNVIRLFYDERIAITCGMNDLLAKLECIQFFKKANAVQADVDEAVRLLLSMKEPKRKKGRPKGSKNKPKETKPKENHPKKIQSQKNWKKYKAKTMYNLRKNPKQKKCTF